jgi:hypothetical protein
MNVIQAFLRRKLLLRHLRKTLSGEIVRLDQFQITLRIAGADPSLAMRDLPGRGVSNQH